jgi:hypothetical protein
MNDEFGVQYAAVIENDQVLTELQDSTAASAIARGDDLRNVWLAICKSNGVPEERWHGLNKPAKKRHAE